MAGRACSSLDLLALDPGQVDFAGCSYQSMTGGSAGLSESFAVFCAPGNASWPTALPEPGNPFTWTSALALGKIAATPRTTKVHSSHIFTDQ